ncbi:UDP-glycosyltransferase [Quillaja saponaria]|uniref:UDP-glycosyltransferase n=1 Tax=Quillaja saponaria TaxID=32244 RepID=A0AAD7VC10_QUISA|nr:UDP-glycosyltransferase [Quillaja saponaria]
MSSTRSGSSSSKSHVLIFPFPAQGHILPILDFTHQLAFAGLNSTILVTPKNLSNLNSLLSTHPSIQTFVLPFPSHPKIPPGVENVSQVGNTINLPMRIALSKLQDPIIKWFKSHPSPPVAIISDFMLGWTFKMAHHLGIPRIAFFSSSAFYASIIKYWSESAKVLQYLPILEFSDLPGPPSFKKDHLPTTIRRYRESDPQSEFLKDDASANFLGWGCVFNSFLAVEGLYLDYLRRKLGHSRVYGVGPLALMGTNNGMDRGNPNSECNTNYVLKWLDECPDGSVLYVCFGSQKFLEKVQMEALANGLELSGTRFVWVVKTGTSTTQQKEIVPNGFVDRVIGRGLVINEWAPQVSILNHPAVAGFLSHCGWNSLLEGITGGAMTLAWPMEVDQFVNARLLEDLGIALRVCEGAEAVPDSAELAKIIANSICAGSPQKVRAKALRDEGIEAVANNGSSKKDLDEFVKLLPQF